MNRRAFLEFVTLAMAGTFTSHAAPEPAGAPIDGYSATLFTHLEYSYYTPRPNGVITSIESPPVVYHGWD